MKKLYKFLAVSMAAAVLLLCTACQKGQTPQESSQETTAEESSFQEEESSKPDKVSQSSQKKESSKVSQVSKKQQSEEPAEYDYYVDGTYNVMSEFSGLLSQNPDTVGWVNIPNSVVDYPVLQCPNDAYLLTQQEDPYYLCRDFYHNNILRGSIFLDYRSPLDSKNLILHGHHMADGSMFATIIGYNSFDFYKASPVVTFNSLYETGKWKIIAVCKTNTLESQGPYFDYMRGDFASDYDFLNYIYQIRLRSIYDCPVTVNEHDTIITMSTCAYDFDEFRMFIVARKVRDGEDSTVNVGRAKKNPSPLYPDIWYYYYGGTKPEVTSFQDALNKKKITWYDGTKTWSQKDDEALPKTLQQAKQNAINQLKTAYEPVYYGPDQLNYIQAYVNAYEGFINDCTNTGRINALTYQCMAVIHSVEKKQVPDAKVSSQKKALQKAKTDAIAAMKKVIANQTYRTNQQQRIDRLMQMLGAKIYAAEDRGTVSMWQQYAVRRLDDVPTDAEMTAQEKKKKT